MQNAKKKLSFIFKKYGHLTATLQSCMPL